MAAETRVKASLELDRVEDHDTIHTDNDSVINITDSKAEDVIVESNQDANSVVSDESSR
jgi:hypothetical protein